MAERGGFGTPVLSNKIKVETASLTDNLTHAPVMCQELREISVAWDTLPEHIRLSVLALVRTVKGGGA